MCRYFKIKKNYVLGKGPFQLRAWKTAFFVSFIDLSALKIEASAKQSKKINKTKNNLFHTCSGNGP